MPVRADFSSDPCRLMPVADGRYRGRRANTEQTARSSTVPSGDAGGLVTASHAHCAMSRRRHGGTSPNPRARCPASTPAMTWLVTTSHFGRNGKGSSPAPRSPSEGPGKGVTGYPGAAHSAIEPDRPLSPRVTGERPRQNASWSSPAEYALIRRPATTGNRNLHML